MHASSSHGSLAWRVAKLLTAVAMIALTWLVGLPWLASVPPIRQQWHELQQFGIDPSAMYYTEIEALQPVLDRMHRKSQRQPEPLP